MSTPNKGKLKKLRAAERHEMKMRYGRIENEYKRFANHDLRTFEVLNQSIVDWYDLLPDILPLLKWMKNELSRKNTAEGASSSADAQKNDESGNDDDEEENAEVKRIAVILCDVVHKFFNHAVTNVGSLLQTVNTERGPCSLLICVMIVVFSIVHALLNYAESKHLESAGFLFFPDEELAARDVKTLYQNGLAITPKPVCQYTVSDVVNAVVMLAYSWENVSVTDDDLSVYMMQLILRAGTLSVTINPPEFYDVEKYQDKLHAIDENGIEISPDETVTTINFNGRRMLLAPLTKMLCVAEFMVSRDVVPFKTVKTLFDQDQLLRFKEKLISKFTKLMQFHQTKKIVDELCEKTRLRYTDVERFQDENPLSKREAKTILQSTHNGDSQFAMFAFHEIVDYIADMKALDETSETYLLCDASFNQHVSLTNAKLLAFDAILRDELSERKQSLDFLQQFVYDEVVFVAERSNIEMIQMPVILIIRSRPYLYVSQVLYECLGVDIALILWMTYVLDAMNGQIDSVFYKNAFESILNRNQRSNAAGSSSSSSSSSWTKSGFVTLC